MRIKSKALMAVAALGLVGLLAACGSGGGQPVGSVKVTMTEYGFDPGAITVPQGKVVFYLVNAGTIMHDMALRDSSGKTIAKSDPVSAGDVGTFTIDNLPAGSYVVYCSQPGHEASGMTGTLKAT